MLDVKIPESSGSKKRKATDSERKEQWSREAANDIQESRKPFEDAITKKWNKLSLLDNYCNAFSDNQIIQLKDLPLGSYNVMAMRETQTQYGEKYIMLIDRNGTLGLCYSNKFIEMYIRENLPGAKKEEILEPKRNYLTLYEKPFASLHITGWGRTPQRNVIVYCNMTFAKDMEKYFIKHLREQVAKEMQEEREKFKQANMAVDRKLPRY
jgi:hypothetical protein